MITYTFLLIFTTITFALSKKSKLCKKNETYYFFTFFGLMAMILVAGLRWGVGTDFFMYDQFFQFYSKEIVFSWKLEPMFMIFCKIGGFFSDKSYFTFLLIALYIYVCIFKVSQKSLVNYDISMFLFVAMGFFFSSLNILRQWMAIAALFHVYDSMIDKKLNKMIIWYFMSILCHYTSIMLFPILLAVYFIKNDKMRNILILISVLIKLNIGLVLNSLKWIVSNIPIFNKYVYYFSQKNTIQATLLWPMLCLGIYLLYLFIISNNKKKYGDYECRKMDIYINLLIFSFMFTLIGTDIDIIERMQYYFIPTIIITIPLLQKYLKINNNKRIYLFGTYLVGILFFVNSLLNNGGGILPYISIFKG